MRPLVQAEGCGGHRTGRAGCGPRSPGGVRRGPVRIVAAQGSARPWGVLPARADAGGPAQVDRADRRSPGRGGALPGAAHFVAVSPWDWRPVRRRLAERLVTALEPTAWAVDDTGFPKDGTHSVGVSASTRARWARPPTASWGCRSTPSLSRPAARWTGGCSCRSPGRTTPRGGQPARCQPACGHRPKWRLVLDMLDGLERWGLRPLMLVADSAWEVGAFRQGLDDRQVPYVVQVKADTSAYPEQVRPPQRPYTGKGRRPRPRYRDKPASLKQLALAAGQGACVDLIWRRGSKGLQRSRFLALRVRPGGSPHADRPPPVPVTSAGSSRHVGCWSNGLPASRSRSSTGCRTCPRRPRWWSWCGWASCAGGWSRTTASARAPWGWTTSRGDPGPGGTTT